MNKVLVKLKRVKQELKQLHNEEFSNLQGKIEDWRQKLSLAQEGRMTATMKLLKTWKRMLQLSLDIGYLLKNLL